MLYVVTFMFQSILLVLCFSISIESSDALLIDAMLTGTMGLGVSLLWSTHWYLSKLK